MGSPFPTLAILAVYLLVVKYGPAFMKKRKALELRLPLVLYNLAVTGLNAWMAYELLYCGLKRSYNFICQLVDTSDDVYELRVSQSLFEKRYLVNSQNHDKRLHQRFGGTTSRSWSNSWTPCFSLFAKRLHNWLSYMCITTRLCFSSGGLEQDSYQEDVHCPVRWSTALFTSSCTSIMDWQLWDTGYKSTCGGRSTWQYFNWCVSNDSRCWFNCLIQLFTSQAQFTTGVVLGLNAILTGCAFTRWMQYVFVGYAFSFILLFGNFYRKAYTGQVGQFAAKSRSKASLHVRKSLGTKHGKSD